MWAMKITLSLAMLATPALYQLFSRFANTIPLSDIGTKHLSLYYSQPKMAWSSFIAISIYFTLSAASKYSFLDWAFYPTGRWGVWSILAARTISLFVITGMYHLSAVFAMTMSPLEIGDQLLLHRGRRSKVYWSIAVAYGIYFIVNWILTRHFLIPFFEPTQRFLKVLFRTRGLVDEVEDGEDQEKKKEV
jgi:hypothetical protein